MFKVALISTFPPAKCGIAEYSNNLIENLKFNSNDLIVNRIELTANPRKNNRSDFVIRDYQIESYFKACDYINSSDIDVIDIQHEYKIFGKPDGKNILILLNKINKPIVTTLHTVSHELPEKRRDIFENIIKRSDLLFLFSEEAKKHLIETYNVLSSKIKVIPHATPLVSFRLPHQNAKRKRYAEDIIFISSGYMRDTKGYEIALRSLNNLKSKIPSFHYFIVGSNHPRNETAQSYRNKLIGLTNKFDLTDKVTFVNKYLSTNSLINLLQLADVCLVPYTRKEQSSSGVLALMISCG